MSGPAFAVRPATLRDLDRLGELYLALGSAYAALDPSYALAIDAGRPWREHLMEGLKADRLRVPVTEDDRRAIVSFLVARVAPSPLGAARPLSGLIEGAWVEPDCRRQGRLRAMYASALRWFQVKRVPSVELVADLRDEAARGAWQALGFAGVQLVMRAAVPPEE